MNLFSHSAIASTWKVRACRSACLRRSGYGHAGVAIPLERAEFLGFTRNDNFQNRNLGDYWLLLYWLEWAILGGNSPSTRRIFDSPTVFYRFPDAHGSASRFNHSRLWHLDIRYTFLHHLFWNRSGGHSFPSRRFVAFCCRNFCCHRLITHWMVSSSSQCRGHCGRYGELLDRACGGTEGVCQREVTIFQ